MFCTFLIFSLPHWHSSRPETVTTEIPVRSTLDSLFEAAMLDMLRIPIDRFVVSKHLLALPVDIQKPTRMSTIHKPRTTAVAMRVAVLNIFDFPYDTTVTQRLSYLLIRIPHLLTLPLAELIEAAAIYVTD